MMKYYQDITLIPDAETHIGFIWHKVFQQIHIALADNKLPDGSSAIAVSFPEYKKTGFPLGGKLRLFAPTEEQLKQLDAEKWLSRLQDYSHVKPIRSVPEVSEYACFKREQFKSNLMKIAARRAKYKNETLNEALKHFQHYQKKCTLPYIVMNSLSMKGRVNASHQFKLFITQSILDNPKEGQFSCYGLSKTATVPWF